MTGSALIVGGAGSSGRHIVAGLAARGYRLTILHRGVHEPAWLTLWPHLHADPHFATTVEEALGQARHDRVVLTYGRIEQLARVFEGRCERLIAVGGVPLYPGFVDPAATAPPGMALGAAEDAVTAEAAARIADPAARKFVTKMLAAEEAVRAGHRRGGYRATQLHYPRIYGPASIVTQEWSVAKRLRDGRRFLLLPNAGQAVVTRCAAENAAAALLAAVDMPDAAAGEVFNVGDARQFSLAQWARLVIEAIAGPAAGVELIGLPPVLNHVAQQFALYGGTMFGHALVSTDKARRLLGYRDAVDPVAAIADSARWWYEHGAEVVGRMVIRDDFDYEREEALRDSLAMLDAAYPARPLTTPMHTYPHPQAPGMARDHHGR